MRKSIYHKFALKIAMTYKVHPCMFCCRLWHQLSIALEEFLSNDKNLRFENMLHVRHVFTFSLNFVILTYIFALVIRKLYFYI